MPEQAPLAAYKQTLVINERLFKIIIGLIVLLIAAIIPYYFLFPLKETNIEFVEFKSGTNNFVTVAKAGREFTNKQLLISMFLRRYVVDREVVDKTTESIRYARVLAFSGDRVATNFQRTHGGKGALVFRDNFKRMITIKRDGALDYGLHQIEFITEDTEDDKQDLTDIEKKPVTQEWTVSIEYKFEAQNVSYNKANLNPLGLKIVQYSLSRREK